MTTPFSKRRRLDAATAQLSKPFRSPFKTPGKSPTKEAESTSNVTNTNLENAESPTDNGDSTKPTALSTRSTNALLTQNPFANKKPTLLPRPNPLSRPGRRFGISAGATGRKFTSPVVAKQLNNDPDIAPLLRLQRELEKTLREIKEELDAAEQALKIEEASRKWSIDHGRLIEGEDDDGRLEIDADLVELCEKWKTASRQAAEELYTQVRERVNRMGGPRAWKEAQKKRDEEQMSYEQEERDKLAEEYEDDSEDASGDSKPRAEKRDLYAEYGIDPETEHEKSQRVGGVEDLKEKPGDEDEFTMGMMLRTLNVELDVVGYDRERQTWVD